jgi:hypothetical protein
MFAPEINAALQAMTTKIGEMSPEAQAIIDRMQAGELSEADALQALVSTMMRSPEIADQLESFAMSAFQPVRELEGVSTPSPDELLIMQPPTGKGNPRLNPMLESTLAERAQFDEDIPELRHGPIPEGVSPAVPVETTARNPVAIGQMLQQASNEMREALDENRRKALGDTSLLLQQTPDGDPGAADEVITFHEDGAVESTVRPASALSPREEIAMREDQKFLAMVTDTILRSEPEGYKTGQLPALQPRETPTGAALAALTPGERRASGGDFLSTTQARGTAVQVIADLVEAGLRSEGVDLVHVSTSPNPNHRDSVPVYAEWVVSMGGAESTQASFNFIDVAAKALTRKLADGLAKTSPIKDPVLEVIPINTVDVRKVGWAARVVPQEEV